MTEYEIQLQYVIRDNIWARKNFFCWEKNCQKKNLSRTDMTSELSQTNQCLSSLSGTHTAIMGHTCM